MRKMGKSVSCDPALLFEILNDNLRDGLCTDIRFTADGKKHSFGAWGDGGNTYKNVVYYFD